MSKAMLGYLSAIVIAVVATAIVVQTSSGPTASTKTSLESVLKKRHQELSEI